MRDRIRLARFNTVRIRLIVFCQPENRILSAHEYTPEVPNEIFRPAPIHRTDERRDSADGVGNVNAITDGNSGEGTTAFINVRVRVYGEPVRIEAKTTVPRARCVCTKLHLSSPY